jgi:hypothetical protein
MLLLQLQSVKISRQLAASTPEHGENVACYSFAIQGAMPVILNCAPTERFEPHGLQISQGCSDCNLREARSGESHGWLQDLPYIRPI